MKTGWIRAVFALSGVYDAVLGVAFLVAPLRIFTAFEVTPPNHIGYVQFPAALLILFAIMYFRVACKPLACRELMLYGAGLKVAYASVALYYEITAGIPTMWVPFAYADLAFLVAFLAAWYATGKQTT